MSQSTETQRPDALLDAYRQASDREGARASANVRAAVLAHARVVAQSLPASPNSTASLSATTRATPAANESKPIWRLAAGVVIGLVGVWIFQLTRPANAPDTTVAAASAPQTDKARAVDSTATTAAPATVAAVTAPASPETAVAAATPTPAPASAVDGSSMSRARADSAGSSKAAESARAEANVTIASAAPTSKKEKADGRAPARNGGNAVTPQTADADAAASEPLRETVIASAELRKSAKVAASPLKDQPAMAAAAPRAPAAVPDAFPAQTAADTMNAAAPAPAPASPPPPASVAAPIVTATAPSAGLSRGALAGRAATAQSDTMKTTTQAAAKPADAVRPIAQLSEIDQVMLRAVRAGDLPALRAAIGRGADVNARDERGRTPLQIARERDDAAVVDALQAAGAR